MGAELLTTLSGVGVSVVTAAGSVWVALAGRRTARQENLSEFAAIKKALNEQIAGLKGDLSEQRTEIQAQRRRVGDQDVAIGWLAVRVRVLVSYIRKAGLEPPAADPMPERVREYIQHIDV